MMKKYVLTMMLACLTVFPAQAKDKPNRLEHKIAEIEREYREDVAEIKAKSKWSDAMKQLRLEQKAEVKDLEIKQAEEIYALKTRQKSEREALRQQEATVASPVEKIRGESTEGSKEARKKLKKHKKAERFIETETDPDDD